MVTGFSIHLSARTGLGLVVCGDHWRDGCYSSTTQSRTGRGTPKGLSAGSDRSGQIDQEQRQELAADLQNIGEDAAIALAAGFDLKLLEVAANTRDIYQAQVELANKAIAIRIRGANLSSDVEGGSLAAAESQAKTSEAPKLRFDAQAWSSTIHDQSLVWWAEYNFGDRRLAPWPKYPVEPDEDRKAKGEVEAQAFTVVDQAEKLGSTSTAQHSSRTTASPGPSPGSAPMILPRNSSVVGYSERLAGSPQRHSQDSLSLPPRSPKTMTTRKRTTRQQLRPQRASSHPAPLSLKTPASKTVRITPIVL
jgi:hypothetical protein